MKFILILILIAFSGFTAWLVVDVGYVAVLEDAFSKWTTTQVFLDLSIACLLLNIIMIRDHITSGRSLLSLLPFLAMTLILGSIGPLLYFIRHTELLDLSGLKARMK